MKKVWQLFYRWEWVLVGSLGSLLIVGIVAAGILTYFYNRAWPGISISGVDVGGRDRQEILALLKNKNTSTEVLVFRGNNYEEKIIIADLGYVADWELTVDQAIKSGKVLFSDENQKVLREGVNLPVRYQLDERKLAQLMNRLADATTVSEVFPEVRVDIDGIVTVEPGQKGQYLNKDKTLKEIYERLDWQNYEPILLDIKVVDPRLSEAEVEVAKQRAQVLMSAKILFKAEDREIVKDGRELAALVGFRGSSFNEPLVTRMVSAVSDEVDRPAENAVFVFDETTGRVKEFKAQVLGAQVEREALTDKLVSSLEVLEQEATTEASVELPVRVTNPEIGVADVNDLGIVELIGEGESYFKGSIPGRIHNIALAASKLNGALIPPGEVISFNQLVGDISGATGYQSAYVIQNGRTILGDGGGVCQVSSTLFRAGLNTGLPVLERKAHSYRVGYYEQESYPGFDATIYSPVVDLKLQNDTPAHILIETMFDKENAHLILRFYGKSDGRVAEIANQRTWGVTAPAEPVYQDDPTLAAGVVKQVEHAAWGAKAAFDWKVTRNGEVLQERTFTSSFRPWQAVYLRGVGQ